MIITLTANPSHLEAVNPVVLGKVRAKQDQLNDTAERIASLPILLIALGAFGGVLAFGFIGLFLGPTFLALGQALFSAWTAITPAADEADSMEGLA